MQFLLTKLLKYWHVRVVSIVAGVLLVAYAYIMPSRTVPSYTDVDAHSVDAHADDALVATHSPNPSGGSSRPFNSSQPSVASSSPQSSGLSSPWLANSTGVAELFASVGEAGHKWPMTLDSSETIRHLRGAAETGQPVAEFLFGHAYSSGFGVPRSMSETVRWYARAAPSGLSGQPAGSPANYPEALSLYRQSAAQGDSAAQLYFGLSAQTDQDGSSSSADAAHWYRLAAAQGSAAAENNLGVLYHLGEAMPKDDAQAASLFTRSANQGNAAAQINLGRMYLEGNGIPRDDHLAAQWLSRAANQGNGHAQILLSTFYAGGHALPANLATAYMWLNLASVSDSHARELRDRLEKVVPADQVVEGQRLTREWLSERRHVAI